MNPEKDLSTPPRCPYCGRNNSTFITDWLATSLEETDKENTAEIEEWQCPHCDFKSFWI